MAPGSEGTGTAVTGGRQGRLNTAQRRDAQLRQITGWKPEPDAADVQCRPGIRAGAGHAVTGNGRDAAGRYLGSRCQAFGVGQDGPQVRGAGFQARPGEGNDVQVGVFGKLDDGVAVGQQAPPGRGEVPDQDGAEEKPGFDPETPWRGPVPVRPGEEPFECFDPRPGVGERCTAGRGPLTETAALPQMGIKVFLHGSGVTGRFPGEEDCIVPGSTGTRGVPGKSAGSPLKS